MRRTLLVAVWIFLGVGAFAQTYGNEWIDYDQPYWTFKIWQNGIRRIDSTSLADAGFPVGDVDPHTIRMYARGRQVPIRIMGEEDSVFNSTDYIEFYGAKNDAWLDSALWDSPAHINDPYYSLYNDTIRYFLTWKAGPGAEREIVSGSGNWAAYTAQPWCWATTLITYPLFYQTGKRTVLGASDGRINEAEGYFRNTALNATGTDVTQTQSLAIPSIYQQPEAPDATYKLVMASANNPGGADPSCMDHHVQLVRGGNVLVDTIFHGYQLNKFTLDLANSSLALPNATIDVKVIHDQTCTQLPSDYPDAHILSWQSIRYPRDLTFAASTTMDVEVPGQLSGDSTLISFTFTGAPVLYAWASDGLHRVTCVNSASNTWKAVLPPSAADMRLFISRPASVTAAGPLSMENGNGYFINPALGLTDSALVIVTHPILMAAAQEYAQYRETNPFNRYNTIVADVDQLYDEFGGGVWHHPMAIRRYLKYVYDHAPTRPQALFLIGKSVKAPQTGGLDYNRGYRVDPLATAACLVPTIGWPSSDMLYGLNLSGTNPSSLDVPVGRLAAKNPTEVLDYLAKMDSTESQPPAAWMKNILHFRGGFTSQEWQLFDAALNSYQIIAEDTSFSGHVTKFVKNGSGIIEQAAADSVHDLIAQGVTLMTFFAHAYGGGFDITIDVPTNYDWHGKFPVMIGNACYTGNIHQFDASSSSEQFVLHENSGALAFLSSVDVGLSYYLQEYTRYFYKSFSQVNYGKSIGAHMRYAVANQMVNGSLEAINSAETLTLHGDPTIVMNSPKEPDLEITPADVSVLPFPVTADVDSFRVRVIVRNIGRGTHVPFSVALQRTIVSAGTSLPPMIRLLSLQHYQDTVYFTLPTLVGMNGQGLNNLQVRVDLDPDLIAESEDQLNNEVTMQININSGDLLPVQPYNFAITPDATPMLKASTGDPFAPPRTYLFQIDTTDLYNSPMMEQHTITAPGGVLQWQPTSIYSLNTMHDSVVYFWRCTLDSAGQGEYNWHEFSFQHITDRQGWGQSHYFQFKNDDFNLMDYDRPNRRFEFFTGPRQIGCEVWGNNYNQVYWTKDLELQDGMGCGTPPALMVGVVDPFDFSTWLTRYGGVGRYYGNVNDNGSCRSRQEKYFIFRETVHTQMESLANMLTNEIPDGHYVVVYTFLRLLRDSVANSSAMEALHALGANHLFNGDVPDNVPYIFFCKKGDPNSVQEIWGDTVTAHIDMSATVQVNARSGSVVPPASCTALSWQGLSWKTTPEQAYDSVRVQLSGVTPQGNEQPILDLPGYGGDLDLQPLLNATQYPQLHLKGSFWNDSLAVPQPAQLRRWQLLGVPAPECALDPPTGYFAHLDSIYQGQPGSVMVAVRNIGDEPMDSLLLAAWVTDHTNQRHLVHYKYNAPLAVGATLLDTIHFGTEPFPGPNAMEIEANPVDTLTHLYDQPEQYHFNNIAVLRFLTQQDIQNPVLDVTFDGIHILDGDIVSSRPEIQVTLDDENQTLLINEPTDTALFKVFLTDPSGAMNRIYFRLGTQEILQFVPADGPDNISKIFYRPVFTQDGKYEITVRATDKSRNNSGDRDNSIHFEVIDHPTISEVLNYPNPFTTSTRFVFTLTGHEVPTAMRIQIMTVTGRVVRDIPMTELGPLHIGRNITEFAWDGTDQFGDRLARGVYLYRVLAQLHGEDIEYRDAGAGGFFKNGIGKMYLLQ